MVCIATAEVDEGGSNVEGEHMIAHHTRSGFRNSCTERHSMQSIIGLAVINRGPQRFFVSYISTAAMVGMSLIYVLFVITQIMGCWWWYLAQVQGIENSWATSTSYKFGPLDQASPIVQWFTSVYFAFSGLVTAMYGDVVATTVPEMFTILVIDLLTLWWWA